jgi:hypothetical protein
MFGEFDEAAYLRANPDVRGLVERGVFRSGFEHWHAVGANEHALGDRLSGFYEHDLIYDEGTYLKQNPDVAGSVRARAVRNGYQHWIRFGRQEFMRGKRLGPFKAPNGLLRPFRVSTSTGDLFVARAPESFTRAGGVEVRVGSAPVAAEDVSVACSRPLQVADACGGVATVRLLIATSPKALDFASIPLGTRIGVSVHSDGSPPIVSTYRDRGIQAFFFPSADDANEFMATARAAAQSESAPPAVQDFVLERLTSSPRRLGYEMPLTFRIESMSRTDAGPVVDGWVALAPEDLASCRAWRPERTEFFDLTRGWSRFSRQDIVDRFPALRSREWDRFGFRSEVKFSQTFPSSPKEKVLFGVTKTGCAEEWIELDAEHDVRGG